MWLLKMRWSVSEMFSVYIEAVTESSWKAYTFCVSLYEFKIIKIYKIKCHAHCIWHLSTHWYTLLHYIVSIHISGALMHVSSQEQQQFCHICSPDQRIKQQYFDYVSWLYNASGVWWGRCLLHFSLLVMTGIPSHHVRHTLSFLVSGCSVLFRIGTNVLQSWWHSTVFMSFVSKSYHQRKYIPSAISENTNSQFES